MSGTGTGSTPARPRQVTIAAVVAAAACGLLVVSLFDAMDRVRSADMRTAVADALAKQGGLGLSVSDVVGVLRGVVFLSAALAAAGVVLAVYALQRHRGARAGLTVVAVVMLFTTTFVTGLLPVLVAAATGRLWGREARDWFDGRSARPRPERPVREATPAEPDSPTGSDSPSGAGPDPASWAPPTSPSVPVPASGADPREPAPSPYAFGTPAPRADVWSAPQAPPAAPAPGAGPWPHPVDGRPRTVSVAAWLTWGFCGIAAAFGVLLVLTVLAERSQLVDAMQRSSRVSRAGLSDRDLVGIVWVTAAVLIAWSLGGIALAVLAYRRVNPARVALAASAALSGLVALLAFPVGLLHAAAGFASVVLLFAGGAGPWYAGRSADEQQPPPGPPPDRQAPPEQQAPPQLQTPPGPQPGPPPAPQPPRDKPPVW